MVRFLFTVGNNYYSVYELSATESHNFPQPKPNLICEVNILFLCVFSTQENIRRKYFDTLASVEQSIDNSSSPENNNNMSREGHAVGYQPTLVPFSVNANARFLSFIMKRMVL